MELASLSATVPGDTLQTLVHRIYEGVAAEINFADAVAHLVAHNQHSPQDLLWYVFEPDEPLPTYTFFQFSKSLEPLAERGIRDMLSVINRRPTVDRKKLFEMAEEGLSLRHFAAALRTCEQACDYVNEKGDKAYEYLEEHKGAELSATAAVVTVEKSADHIIEGGKHLTKAMAKVERSLDTYMSTPLGYRREARQALKLAYNEMHSCFTGQMNRMVAHSALGEAGHILCSKVRLVEGYVASETHSILHSYEARMIMKSISRAEKVVKGCWAIEIGFGVYDVYEAYRHGKDAIKEAMKVIGELGAEAVTATLSMEIGAAVGEGLAIAFCLTPVGWVAVTATVVTAAAVTLAAGKVGGMLAEKLTDESRNTYHQLTQSLHEHIRSHV